MFSTIPQNLCLFSIPYIDNKIRVNPCNPWLKIAKVEYTGCPITLLFCKTNPIFANFGSNTRISHKNKPNSNPIKPNFWLCSCVLKSALICVIRGLVYYLFMQNEPNFIRRWKIASAVMTRRCDNIAILSEIKNEPKRTQTYIVWAIWVNPMGGFLKSVIICVNL